MAKIKGAAKSKSTPKPKYAMAASAADLGASQTRKLLIGGQLVFAALHSDSKPPKAYVAQQPREAVPGLLAGFRKNNPKVHVHVHPNVLDHSKARFAFLIDAYVGWGVKQRKGSVAVIGGIEQKDGGFHVDVLVFDTGRLVSLYDLELPERSSPRFDAAAASVVARIAVAHPKARIVQVAPLDNWNLQGVEYLGDKPLRSLSFRPIGRGTSNKRHLLLPASIVAAGAIFNAGSIGLAWGKYSESIERYDVAARDPMIVKQGGIDSNYINVMTQRRLFMETPRRQDLLPNKILTIVRGIGVLPSVQIVEMKLPAPSLGTQPASNIVVDPEGNKNPNLITADRVPDTWMRISVPKSDGSALDQAHDVLARLADSTGMTLRLVQRGWQEDGARRIFTIEGFIHG